jgi:hypothetical protein
MSSTAPYFETPSAHMSLSVTDRASNPYITTGILTVLYILIFILSNSKPEDKRFWTKVTITQEV